MILDNDTNIFALGSNVKVQQADKKTKLAQKGEERLAGTLGVKDATKVDAKRDRDNYAVSLRKQKR